MASVERPSKREANKAAKRAAILNSASSLFFLKGYENTTLNEIADKAGVHPQTIFLYFPNKESLVIGMLSQYLGLSYGYNLKDYKPNVFNAFTKQITQFLSATDTHEQILAIFWMVENLDSVNGYNLLQYKRMEQRLAVLFAEEKGVAVDDHLDGKILAGSVISMLWDSVQQWGLSNGRKRSSTLFNRAVARIKKQDAYKSQYS